MIRELIELAEEMYARGHNPNLDPVANGEDFKTFAIRLGHKIEEVGHTLRRYQERLEQQAFHIKHLQNRIKELEQDDC
jgi:hypothetical protein